MKKKKTLYKKFSLWVHPDKIKSNLDQSVLSYLTDNDLIDTPQKILGELNKTNILKKITSAHFSWLMRLIGHMIKMRMLKSEMNKMSENSPSFNSLKEELAKEKRNLRKLAPVFSFILDMETNLNRYFQPLRFFAKAINTLIFVILSIGITLFTLVETSLSFLIENCLNLSLNVHTMGVFQEKCETYRKEKFPEMKAKYINLFKSLDEETTAMTDQDFLNLLENNVEEEALDNLLKVVIPINGITKLKLIASSFYSTLTQPLPEGFINKTATIVVWPFRLLTAVPLFLLATAIEMTKSLLNGVFLIIGASASLGWVGSLFALNTPLFACDAVSYVMTGINNARRRSPPTPSPSKTSPHSSHLYESQSHSSTRTTHLTLPKRPVEKHTSKETIRQNASLYTVSNISHLSFLAQPKDQNLRKPSNLSNDNKFDKFII